MALAGKRVVRFNWKLAFACHEVVSDSKGDVGQFIPRTDSQSVPAHNILVGDPVIGLFCCAYSRPMTPYSLVPGSLVPRPS